MKYPPLDLSKIITYTLPEGQYHKEEFPKKQIVLHHTASGPGVKSDIKWWIDDPRRVATAVLIDRSGEIYKCFESKYWASHLGTTARNNKALDQGSIGIEIDSWGPLVKYGQKFRSYLGTEVPKEEVVEYPGGFRTIPGSETDKNYFYRTGVSGQKAIYYHKYTDAQIYSVAQLLELWGKGYNIPLNYNPDMWAINQRALAQETGVWTHVSYRSDKLDCHPQPELIEMLKSLTE